MSGCSGLCVSGSNSLTRTRPGLAQSFGCVLSGSRVMVNGWGPGFSARILRSARSRVYAKGLAMAMEEGTRRPVERVREESKYTG